MFISSKVAGLDYHIDETLEFSNLFLKGNSPRSMISVLLFICFPYEHLGLMKEENFLLCESGEKLFGGYGQTLSSTERGFELTTELQSIWCLFQ